MRQNQSHFDEPHSPPRPSDERLHLLVIDDDRDAAQSTAWLLRQLGLEVFVAFDGSTGLKAGVALRPQAIVTDLLMPGDTGDFVIECLQGRNDTWQIPIVVLTGMRDDRLRQRLLCQGVIAYLTKPVDRGELLSALCRCIPALAGRLAPFASA